MGASQFLFVSSAGIYESTVTPPLTEADPVKFTSGHAEVERYAASQQSRHGMHFSSFRPQYIVGAGNNKDCE
jgi:nucleoside-diphosphate-sugar epimerase